MASEEEKEPAAAAAKKDQKQPQRCFVLHCCGLAVRRHDLPTQAQQANTYRGDEKQQPREPAAAADAERAARDRLKSAGGYALRKSRFSTSKCATCKETILPGQYIARAESHEGRGGWSHVGCIASSGVETAAAAAAAPTKPTPRGVATSADRADTSHKTAARTKKTASNDAPPEAEVPPRSTVSRKRK